jgi:hypothetical protein
MSVGLVADTAADMAPPKPKSERCETCRFWLREAAGVEIGMCRRRPPVIQRRDAPFAVASSSFPETDELQWCGGFEWLSHLEPVSCC